LPIVQDEKKTNILTSELYKVAGCAMSPGRGLGSL